MLAGQTAISRIDQRGAALVVSLILLLIMTIIGIAAMNGARLEVSMAGMMQREEVALRSAERALAAAERYTRDSISIFDATQDGHYLPENKLDDLLDEAGTSWSGIVTLDETDVSELSEHDAFVVEYQGEMVLPGSALNDGGDLPIPGDKVKVYRIISRSDTEGNAVRIVESIYTKLYNPMAP
jgi:type IV pilus assembly protein PilX